MFKKHKAKKVSSRKRGQIPEDILKELRSVNSNLIKQNSFRRGFFLSVVQGIGTAIGATLFAGITIAIIYKIIISIDTFPLIQKILPKSAVEQFISPPPSK